MVGRYVFGLSTKHPVVSVRGFTWGMVFSFRASVEKTRQLGLPGNHQNGDPDWIRTNDTRFRKPVLYPLSYEAM